MNSAKCVDDNGQSTANGKKIQLWDCNGGATSLDRGARGTLQVYGKCMDITGANYANGTSIELWDLRRRRQPAMARHHGTLVNPASGKCLDDPASNTANGTQLDLWTCNGASQPAMDLPC